MLSRRSNSKSGTTKSVISKLEERSTQSSFINKRFAATKEKSTVTSRKGDAAYSDSELESDPTKESNRIEIPEVLRRQSTSANCFSNVENDCPCNTLEAVEQVSKQISYSDRRNYISVERLNELRKKAQDAIKNHRIFTIRGCFFSVRNALAVRGWVEKLDAHRKYGHMGMSQVSYEDLAQNLPKRRPGESRRQYLIKCERNIMSRFLEHVPIDFLWTARREKCDWIDQAKNPSMIINRFHRAPFTSKEGLCGQLRDFHWFFEEGVSEMFFPRCFNVWSPEELTEFTENFRMTACIGFLKCIEEKYRASKWDGVFAQTAKIPFSAIDFAMRRCNEFVDACNHSDIDNEDQIRIWEHDWDAFLTNHFLLTHEQSLIQADPRRCVDNLFRSIDRILKGIESFWPQYHLDGCLNIWIVKPANKCRGRGIQLLNNIKKILNIVNPPTATKARYVVQKYLERPLIIHSTKFDIRQWFLVSSVQPLIVWMYKESYLRFSSQEYNLLNYHESVHLTNHAIQKKYRNGKRDERLPTENMWDCYTFQAYLRQIGQYDMWAERIYPGMRHAIIGAMLASQDSMDRRINNFELFGADFMISENFDPWLIEINSSPDLGATTSVTARMCPQCLEDTIKVIIDRRVDINADTGNFEMIYRQSLPPVPAYMGLNLFLKGKQILPKINAVKKDRPPGTIGYIASTYQPRTALPNHTQSALIPMPTYRPNFELDVDRTVSRKPTVISDLLDNLLPIEAKRTLMDSNLRPFSNKSPLTSSLISNTMLQRCATSPAFRTDIGLSSTATLHRPYTQNSLSSISTALLSRKHHYKSNAVKVGEMNPFAKRYFSCGPRIRVTREVEDVSDENNANPERRTVDEMMLVPEIVVDSPKRPAVRCVDENVSPPQVNSALQRLHRSKSAKMETELMSSAKKKSSVPTMRSSSSTIRSSLFARKYAAMNGSDATDHKSSKTKPPKIISDEHSSSPFYAVGMSLRAWKSRQHKIKKTLSQTNATLSNVRHRTHPGAGFVKKEFRLKGEKAVAQG